MTVILILLCLAIAGREIYMAFDRRLPTAQAEILELQNEVAELSRRLEDHPPETTEAVGEGQEEERAETAPGDVRVAGPLERRPGPRVGTPSIPPAGKSHSAVAAVSGAVIRRLETELGETARKLAELERDLAMAREAGAAQARSLDTMEQTVGVLYREMTDRLEREADAVRGLLYADESAIEPILTAAYEACVDEYGLRVRAKEPFPGSPWYTGYLMSGVHGGEGLARRLLDEARSLHERQRPSSLGALLSELAHLQGEGVARIGAFTAVRTHAVLTCGLLTGQPAGDQPGQLADLLHDLPGTVRWDPAAFTAE